MSYQLEASLALAGLVVIACLWLGLPLLSAKGGEKPARGAGVIVLTVATCLAFAIAWFIYQQVGASQDLAVKDQIDRAFKTGSEAELAKAIDAVEARLIDAPDNLQYLALAGMLQAQAGKASEAEERYRLLLRAAPDSADAHAEFAQQRYLAKGSTVDAKVLNAVRRALELDPNNITALGLRGIAAYEMSAFDEAARSWGKGMQLSDENSAIYGFLANGAFRAMQSAKQAKAEDEELADKANAAFERLMKRPELLGAETLSEFLKHAGSAGKREQNPEYSEHEGDARSLSVAISYNSRTLGALREFLARTPAAKLLVYTRAANGPRMPLAIRSFAVSEKGTLPTRLSLSAADAMMPAMSIASVDQQELIFRLAPSGKIEPGDLNPIILARAAVDFTSKQALSASLVVEEAAMSNLP